MRLSRGGNLEKAETKKLCFRFIRPCCVGRAAPAPVNAPGNAIELLLFIRKTPNY